MNDVIFVYIVFHVDPASGLPSTINVCACSFRISLLCVKVRSRDDRGNGIPNGNVNSHSRSSLVRSIRRQTARTTRPVQLSVKFRYWNSKTYLNTYLLFHGTAHLWNYVCGGITRVF